MPDFSSRVTAAAEQVLTACLASSTPVATLAEGVSALREKATWTEEELEQVELAVHERLVTIYGRS
jgi:hypothetical protein